MLRISWEEGDKDLIIALEGELDHQDCLEMRDEFDDRIRKGDGDVIVVMEGVTFLSSMGIGMLVQTSQTLEKQGRTLKLSGIPPNIRKVMESMQLMSFFSVL
ncbi:MAG: STAS domain-containing protein [Planctomycetota bacterium]|jgi:anti-anti-sigma factor